jgi:hypothetical protein
MRNKTKSAMEKNARSLHMPRYGGPCLGMPVCKVSRSRNFVFAVLLLLAAPLFAQQATDLQADQQAYCEYLSQQAMAQRDLLRTPSAVAGVTQPSQALPLQLVWGVTTSLSDIKKAGLTMDAARKNCDLYTTSTSAQQVLQYALPNLEKQALEHRLDLIQQASDNLDTVTARMTKVLDAQNITRPMLFSLQATRVKLNADRADTQSKIAALYVPDIGDTPLKELIAKKQDDDAAEQQAQDRLSRQSDWDVQLSLGARQQVNPLDNRGVYGAVTVSYNLGSHAINKHLDQAAGAYDNWKKVQQGDVTRSAQVLKQQLTQSIAAQQARLKSLHDEENQVNANLQLVSNVDTTAALDFQNQLTSTQLVNRIEIGDASFRLQEMEDFVERNF